MADSDDTTTPNPGGEPDRDSVSGRYKSRHDESAKDGDGEKKEENGKKRWLLLLLLLLILLLLLCAGFAYMKWWKKDTGNTTPSTSPTVAVTTEAPKTSPTPSASPSPSPSPSPKTVAMPNVVGKPAAEAKATLEAAGLTNFKFVAEGKPGEALTLLESYVVTAQSVPAGTQLPLDGAITLTCKTSSSGKG